LTSDEWVLLTREMTMVDIEKPSDVARSMMIKNVEQAHREIANYFQFVEKAISASPSGSTDQTKAFRVCVERSVAASFELSDKLLRAKDLQDVLRIQTNFFQTQLRALTEQSRDLCEEAAASDVTDMQIK
jgi:hypothetical protein